ncbi:hypothetical protein [Aquiflexum sp.]|uniref:hypothetical protein n=1 Tax=Aquiflexum sp. TaxID=1872584 RepID=UPI0035932CDE
MDDLYVKTKFRVLGIETELINQIIDLAKSNKCLISLHKKTRFSRRLSLENRVLVICHLGTNNNY